MSVEIAILEQTAPMIEQRDPSRFELDIPDRSEGKSVYDVREVFPQRD